MRSIFLLIIVVGLTIFALQNLEPALSLVFLGVRSPALPLSIWVLSSIAAGVVASLLISSLLSFSNYLSQSRTRSGRIPPDVFPEERRTSYTPPSPSRKQEIDPDRYWENRETQAAAGYRTEYGTPAGYDSRTVQQEPPPPNPPNVKQPVDAIDDGEDDWVSDSSKNRYPSGDEDWGEETENPARPTVNDATAANRRDYETKQEPKSKSWTGSVYSFGYRDPSKSGVGETESVYDAEYRVLVPPDGAIPQAGNKEIPNSNSDEDDEDWGLDDDDDVFDGDSSSSKQQPDRS
jgi:uncharacterized integral membrane protein